MSLFDSVPPRRRQANPVQDEAAVVQARIDLERRRWSIANSRDVLGTEHVIKGRTQLQGSGEATINLTFPVLFIEPPTFTFGAELALGSVLEAGQFPIVSCCISAWGPNGEGAFRPDAPSEEAIQAGAADISLREYYTGAVVACVATGPSAQNVYIHWMFTGVALTNPFFGSTVAGASVPLETTGVSTTVGGGVGSGQVL